MKMKLLKETLECWMESANEKCFHPTFHFEQCWMKCWIRFPGPLAMVTPL